MSAPVDPSYGFGLLFGDFVDEPSAPRVTVCVSTGFAGGIFGADGVDGLVLPRPPLSVFVGIEAKFTAHGGREGAELIQ